MSSNLILQSKGLLGGLRQEAQLGLLPDSQWFTAQDVGDGLSFEFPAGALEGMQCLSADFVLDGNVAAVFVLVLQEGEDGPAFGMSFGLLNQCQARMRVPLEAVNQNVWMYPREGAWLKPTCRMGRVDLSQVDRLTLTVDRMSSADVRWCMTPLTATAVLPPRLEQPLLPQGALLDEMGQSRLHDWPEKTRSVEEMKLRMRSQLHQAPAMRWPEGWSRWGGWQALNFGATGWFRTHQDGKRWWLVDPDGCAFWSSGLDCVEVDTDANIAGLENALEWAPAAEGEFAPAHPRPEMANFLAANLIRAFGAQNWQAAWAQIALGFLRDTGFNTVANWSDWQAAQRAGFPYVRPLESRHFAQTPNVYRDFPDVFHPAFAEDARAYAGQLRPTAEDAAFIGYFLMNEPTWGFATENPARGMLFNTPHCRTRRSLADYLRKRYVSETALSIAWNMPVTFAQLEDGEWSAELSPTAEADLADFSSVMVKVFFSTLSRACREVDPHHLNLGVRYYTIPPEWALEGMRTFDVFSMNCYRRRIPRDEIAEIASLLHMPVMIGEWHFGALDAGLPASGIGAVTNQQERGKAYRVYLEDAAACPDCVGAHYFILYDQSALGRFDGENYNIGFLDICHRPYELLVKAAQESHGRMYALASGQETPFADQPAYTPPLFYG